MQVHQYHPTVTFGDAISNQMLSLQRLLQTMGYQSYLFCDRRPDHFQGRVLLRTEYADYAAPGSVLLAHYSLYYPPETMAWLDRLPGRKVIVYHNVTPYAYLARYDPAAAEAARLGREQLGEVLALADAAWGDSAYNRDELAERGAARLGVLPIVFEPGRYAVRPERKVLRQCRGGLNTLFVGRVAPHKCFEDLIVTFAHLQRHVRPGSRLLLVGSARGMEAYAGYLRALVEELGLSGVMFAGHVSAARLAAYYRSASVYLSMSEHEGFGVPLLESMFYGLPILAFKAGAVSETLGGTGILLVAKEHAAVAELIGLLAEDVALRERLIAGQRVRLQAFMPDRVRERLGELLGALD
jgi:glycosyltransferase involved in cell wall biosynthesis